MAFFILTGSAGHASAPTFPTYTVSVTAYNAVAAQTDGDPSITASGAFSNPAVVAARSRDLAKELPFGTVIAIEPAAPQPGCGLNLVGPSIGYRVIADTMNARITNTVDVLFPNDITVTVGSKTVSAARTLGFCKEVEIRIVGFVDISRPSNLPKSQAALAAVVGAAGLALK